MAAWNPDLDQLPKAWHWYLALAGLIVFLGVTWIDGSDRGALSGFATAVILLAARSRWDLKREPYFWVFFGIAAAIHTAAIVSLPVILATPTIIVAPLVIVDFAALIYGIYAAESVACFLRDRIRG